jgi:hypothetical protein
LVVLWFYLKLTSSSEAVTRNLFIRNVAPAGAGVWDPAALADTGWEEGIRNAAAPTPTVKCYQHGSSLINNRREARS